MLRSYPRVLHWFRRDLRLTDNPALHAASAAAKEVVPVYLVSPWRGSHAWTGAPRQEFLSGCLQSLARSVAAAGGRLVFRRGEAVAELIRLVRETGAEAVFYNNDPDPFGRATEAALAKAARQEGFAVHSCQDAVLHGADEVLTLAGKPYRVFTAYRRNWESLAKPPVLPAVRRFAPVPPGVASDPCPTLETWGLRSSGTTVPEPGERSARERMRRALSKVIPHYADTRNLPAVSGTSRLSVDLRMGTLSVRELFHRVASLMEECADAAVRQNGRAFLGELAWRDFYFQILHHFPEVLEHEFDPQWRGLPWSWDESLLERWKEGTTGFPIVDAGMRQLKATGWMHNRVRMITAMFLTKDLRLDWRLGEQFFMQSLIDGEIASNNGGWQWSAGTGADAAPYFRIQNPWTQTGSYDPEGTYIRRWVPELKNAPMETLLGPPRGGSGLLNLNGYSAPMVDHSKARQLTLEFFKKHRAAR